MRIAVNHSTVYRYDRPVLLDPHIFRFRPRTNLTQRLLAFDLQIEPAPAGMAECLDQDGNFAQLAWFNAPTQELSVACRFSVEMLQQNPFDFVLTGDSLLLPMQYPEPLATALGPYRSAGHVADSVREYARSACDGAGGDTLSFLAALNSQIYLSFAQVIRPEGAPWPSHLTLERKEGSCRDLAVLFCDLCRAAGVAARFVSGYELEASAHQESYMHAWAEVYLQGPGWRGYDPSRGLAVARGHVTVAAAFDHDLACPVAGLYRGDAASTMEATLSMHVTPDRAAAR